MRNDIGPISPGRWQLTQLALRIGATSLWNVGAFAAAGAGVCVETPTVDATARIDEPASTNSARFM